MPSIQDKELLLMGAHHRHRRGRHDTHAGPPFGFGPFRFGPEGQRARRGDVRAAIVALLAERPRHGYEMIQEIESRTEGLWRPSAGSIYPTLQLLEDEGLITGEQVNGKRRFTLTDAGRADANERSSEPPPWEQVTDDAGDSSHRLGREIRNVMLAFRQVMQTGSGAQKKKVLEILADTRRRIYAVLGEDE
jgi:DNA-binding PadR family transcriptional regulator